MPRKTNETVEETTEATEAATTEAGTPQLTLADVKNAVNVIDYAANQGCFKGWDTIAQVMQVRQRLAAFVEAASPAVEGEAVENSATETQEAANS